MIGKEEGDEVWLQLPVESSNMRSTPLNIDSQMGRIKFDKRGLGRSAALNSSAIAPVDCTH